MRSAPPASDLGSLGRLFLPLALAAGAAVILSRGLVTARLDYAVLAAAAGTIFVLVFLKTEIGLYLVIVSMLLSPEFSTGGVLAERRQIVLRSEDFLLLVIAASWFAKTAVNKELGLVSRTPLNRPIFVYVAVNAIATAVGAVTGSVGGPSGFFFVLKYVEYFVVYYMVVNNVSERRQLWRLVTVAFVTALIVSLVGMAQIPSGQRVSAPFEGDAPEPNTFGGYMLLMLALVLGVAIETRSLRVRTACLGLVVCFVPPFLFTLSRASYLGLAPLAFVLVFFSRRRRVLTVALLVMLVASPLLLAVAPEAVVRRVAYTFEPEAGQATVKVGRLALDPSTSARFISMRQAFEAWRQRPVLGYGVTGFGFIDSQYARTLVESGLVGLVAFFAMTGGVFSMALNTFRAVREPDDRGLALGFIAATVALLAHAIGSNTFIIVRIMEPFWLFAGIVTLLPTLPPARVEAGSPSPWPVRRAGPR